MYGLISFALGSDYSHRFPLHLLCKGEALELFSVGQQLISSQNGDWISPAVVMREFVHSLSYFPCISEPSPFISHEETDEQPDQMDFYPNA